MSDNLAVEPAAEHRGNQGPHINASVVVVVVILSAVLILSGLLHLLARCLRRRGDGSVRGGREHSPLVSALHGQLQHLFLLHDAGVEQAFIDTLPVFAYASIRGLKDSTDCAVCLTEFGDDDRLRLLPKCKHAFHLECIDTWLLSNSTCPLCRRSLLPDRTVVAAAASTSCDETAASTSDDVVRGSNRCLSPDEQLHPSTSRRTTINSLHGSIHGSYQNSFRICDALSPDHDSGSDEIQEIDEIEEIHEIQELEDDRIHHTPSPFVPTIRVMDQHGEQMELKVELGRVAARRRQSSRVMSQSNARSYSMGSYEYIVDPSSWEVVIAPTPYPGRPQDWAPSKPTHRSALSDSIPELTSAGVTPANDELFWACRGLYNPHTLSRVRELLTPISSEYSASHGFSSCSPGQGDRWIDIDLERGEIEQGEIVEERRTLRSSSLSRLVAGEGKVSVSCFRRSFSETSAGMDVLLAKNAAAAAATAAGDATAKQGSTSSRRFSLNWLMGRERRMVFASASPFLGPESEQTQLRPITM